MKPIFVPLLLSFLSPWLLAEVQPVSVSIKTPTAQMKYDTAEFQVTPGAKVQMTLVNDDDMPHNWVLTKPSADKGLALAQTAWAMGEQGTAKHWVPTDPRVIVATKTVPPHGKESLTFDAPMELGSYPYVCTFPGHAMVMNGVMRVVAEGAKLTDGKFKLFLGKWDKLPDFSTLKPLREGALDANLIGWKFDDYKNEFGIRFTGKLEVKTEGEHTFRLASDDGSRFSLDGKVLLQNDGIHPPGDEKLGKVKLKPGMHEIQLDYFQGGGGAELYFSWQGPNFSETWLSKMQLGAAAKKSKSDHRVGIPLVVKDEAIIYRNFIAGVGARGIAVGLPGGVNAAFDAELCNVALVWRGAFMDAARHWTDRGSGSQPPLGYGVATLERNVPLAVLESGDSPWPGAPKELPWGDWPAGYRFGGYVLDKKGIPTFRYTFLGVSVEDRMEAALVPAQHEHSGAAMQRIITLKSGKAPAGLHLRLALGKGIAEGRNGVFPIAEGVTLQAAGAIVRGAELLVPVSFKDGAARVEVTYSWNH